MIGVGEVVTEQKYVVLQPIKSVTELKYIVLCPVELALIQDYPPPSRPYPTLELLSEPECSLPCATSLECRNQGVKFAPTPTP